jgi:hypothetical protein
MKRLKTEIEETIVYQVSVFNYLAGMISETKQDINLKIQKYNKINETLNGHFGKKLLLT